MVSYRISIIGSGNLAWHLASELENAGHRIVEVSSRNIRNAKSLATRLYNANIKTDYDFTQSASEVIILAVSDDAIEDIAREVVLDEHMILLHTSGSKPIELLGYAATDHTGVFYPLQSFTKKKRVNFQEIPILIEGSDKHTLNALNELASSISSKVIAMSGEQRRTVHLAAVFSCNLTNHLLRIAQDILAEKKLPFDLLNPLITETITKSLALGPAVGQTGPAVREDYETLDMHMELLKNNPSRSEIYRLISQDIIDGKYTAG